MASTFATRATVDRAYVCAIALAAISLAACTSRTPATPSTTTSACTSLSVDPASETVDAGGGDRTIAVTTNSECAWTAAVASGDDGKGAGHFAVVRSIVVRSNDGATMAVGQRVGVFASLERRSSAVTVRIYHAADALHPHWTYAGGTQLFDDSNEFGVPINLPPGELQAVRVTFSFGGGFSTTPCAVGSDDDNDDLVFRVQQQ